MILYLGAAFSIWMAVDAVRRGYTVPWLWIILCFPLVGGVVYLLVQSPLPDALRGRMRQTRYGRRDLERAAAEAERLDRAELWTEYATMLRERRRPSQAVEAARRAVERDPSSHYALYELGIGLLATGDAAGAIAPLRKIVDEDFGFATGEAAFTYCEALIKSGDSEAALPHLERLGETSSRPRFLYGLAAVQAQVGQRDAARATLQRIIDESVDVPRFAEKETRRWVRRAKKAQRRLGSMAA